MVGKPKKNSKLGFVNKKKIRWRNHYAILNQPIFAVDEIMDLSQVYGYLGAWGVGAKI